MNKNILCAIGVLIGLLTACQPAPNDNIPVPTTANTNAVNTVAAASATAKAEPTATQSAPTVTPPPTATAAPSPTPSPAPTTAASADAPPWAGKLKRIPGATDPDGFVYEVPPEALAGIEDWVRRFQEFVDKTNQSPDAQFSVSANDMAPIAQDPFLEQTLSGRRGADSLWIQKTLVELHTVRGMSSDLEVECIYLAKPMGSAKQYERGTLKLLSEEKRLPVKILVRLKLGDDGLWRITKYMGALDS